MRGKTVNTSSPFNTVDVSQVNTAQAVTRTPQEIITDSALRPPASRRAASTGGIGLNASSSRSSSQSPVNSWEPGMPLPPPPPGPPPAGARSQSLSRHPEANFQLGHSLTAPVRSRHAPGCGTNLDAIPPTPADWKDEDVDSRRNWTGTPNVPTPLHIDTGSLVRRRMVDDQSSLSSVPTDSSNSSHQHRGSSSGMLLRSPAVRNRSAKGIRERRSESRSGFGRAPEVASAISMVSDPWDEALDNIKPTDLVLARGGDTTSRRRTFTRPSPNSGKSMRGLDEALESASGQESFGQATSFGSLHSTPRPESTINNDFPKGSTPTPPFSPGKEHFGTPLSGDHVSSILPPRALPTPPPQRLPEGVGRSSLLTAAVVDARPVSHLLHIPNQDVAIQVMPLSPESSQSMPDLLGPESPKAFAGRAIDRHNIFAGREASATSDAERLHLFSQYIIAESRIRRDRYASVFEEEDIVLSDLMLGMFDQPHPLNDQINDNSDNAKLDNGVSDGWILETSNSRVGASQRRSTSGAPMAERPAKLKVSTSPQARPESTWWNDYVPCLSPIASMSAVTGQDEMHSRGRTPSRWWESNSGGSNHGDAFKVLERSKRESKYMGLPLEARDPSALYGNGRPQSFENSAEGVASASHLPVYGPNEYPPEKTGWHEQYSIPPPPQPLTPQSAPYTPNPKRMDISRLVTLPPPYPRHHPAVNNNHPELADTRAVIRSLHDEYEAESMEAAYQTRILEKRQRADSWCKHQKSLHNQDMQYRMEHGEISQEQYDEAEANIEAQEVKSEKDVTQADFDLFQNTVVSPLHALFAERITNATKSFDQLSTRLLSDAQSHSPNLPQEEGDEQPELLEKLTQLKWLFEARETLHRKTYDLLSERNDRYKAIVLLPYKQSHNHDKIADAESFFAKDALDRRIVAEKSALARAEDLLAIIETNVVRGVEIQLSAFWDIAPALLKLLQQIPYDLVGFEIVIPQEELAENPLYWSHPLQYLYSLVGHTEKSTYQFIESQVNLLCLLHEVRSGVLSARCKLQESLRYEGGGEGRDEVEVEAERRREEARLTDDLKEKVGIIEGQWDEALGQEVRCVKERVREWLIERGGWDEDADEG